MERRAAPIPYPRRRRRRRRSRTSCQNHFARFVSEHAGRLTEAKERWTVLNLRPDRAFGILRRLIRVLGSMKVTVTTAARKTWFRFFSFCRKVFYLLHRSSISWRINSINPRWTRIRLKMPIAQFAFPSFYISWINIVICIPSNYILINCIMQRNYWNDSRKDIINDKQI